MSNKGIVPVVLSGGAAEAGPTTLISDTFTDANDTVLASHTIAPTNTPATSWTVEAGGTISIQSNKAFSDTASKCVCDPADADVTLSAVMQMTSIGANSAIGIVARYTDIDNHWMVRWYNGTFEIVERTASVETQRDTEVFAISADTDYTIQAVLNGTSITATLDGLHPLSYTSASHQAATKHGMQLYAAGGQSSKGDNFTVAST
jgi:hypothetical protein